MRALAATVILLALAVIILALAGCAVTPPPTFAERMAEMQAQVKLLQAMREPAPTPVAAASEDKDMLQRILRLLDDLFGRVERLEAK